MKIFTVIEKYANNGWDFAENKPVPKFVKVYAVRDDKNGYPQFLVYDNGEWKYRSAKYYCEAEEDY